MRGERHGSAREQLLHAAIALFSTRGYAGTSIREIVEAAGVTKPALYYHFESKAGIYRAIGQAIWSRLEEFLAAHRAAPGPARARIEKLLLGLFDLFEREKPAVRFLNAAYWGPRQGAPELDLEWLQRRFLSAVGRMAEEGMAAGELRRADPADVSRTLLAVLSSTIDLTLAHPRLGPGRAGLRRAIALVFDGIAEATCELAEQIR